MRDLQVGHLLQDGRSSSLTAPHGPSQQDVVRAALERAAATPAELAGMQLHGTGTPLGDPIEVGALCDVVKVSACTRNQRASAVKICLRGGLHVDVACCDTAVTWRRVCSARRHRAHHGKLTHVCSAHAQGCLRPLHLTAIKSRLGHAEAGAGIMGALQVVARLSGKATDPILHLRAVNPHMAGILALRPAMCRRLLLGRPVLRQKAARATYTAPVSARSLSRWGTVFHGSMGAGPYQDGSGLSQS